MGKGGFRKRRRKNKPLSYIYSSGHCTCYPVSDGREKRSKGDTEKTTSERRVHGPTTPSTFPPPMYTNTRTGGPGRNTVGGPKFVYCPVSYFSMSSGNLTTGFCLFGLTSFS